MTESEGSSSTSSLRVLEELQLLPIAEELGKSRLERMAGVATLEESAAGALLFREGGPADHPQYPGSWKHPIAAGPSTHK